MSSREQAKREAREARQAREAEEAARERRVRRLRLLGGVAALAVVLVVVALVASGGSDDEGTPAGDASAAQVVREVATSLRGVPQDGIALGRKDAKVTMVEFADPQCPFCADFANNALPTLVAEDVKAGRLRLELQWLTFLDRNFGTEDSDRIARLALAAGQQDRMWHVAEAAFRLQGEEGSGYATDEFLRSLVTGVPGLDADKALADMDSPEVDRALATAQTAQGRYGIDSTPSFLTGRTGGDLTRFEASSLTAEPFTARVRELAGG